ncbi:hypothetical protein I553_3321 [Mycobacterium xenopi 4042]|uniref:Uncharacterized protein n=1 Tax=Mycobacterium xenopi 4042 TaxID=1299334 RepID=X8CLN4_MYCXE|nr:hypothetical protein I553_3321 [Mycobacterium xenopi 4042]
MAQAVKASTSGRSSRFSNAAPGVAAVDDIEILEILARVHCTAGCLQSPKAPPIRCERWLARVESEPTGRVRPQHRLLWASVT